MHGVFYLFKAARLRPSTVQSLSKYCLIVGLLSLPWVGWMASQVRFGTAYVEAWLPVDAPVRVAYRQYRNQFGADQFLLISWQGCQLDDPRLALMAESMRELAAARPEFHIRSVQDSASAVNTLASGRRRVSVEQAISRLEGLAIGKNGACFIALQLDEAGLDRRSELISLIEQQALATSIQDDQLIMAGEPFQIHMIDLASRQSMQYYVLPSSLLALFSAWFCLKSLRLTLLVFLFAGVGQVLGLALIAYFFGEMSAVMVVVPTLIFMLTLSGAVHLANYYLDSGGAANGMAGVTALSLGLIPCLLATVTTVIGFGSLAVSHLSPVWQFGCLASLGLGLSTLFMLSSFPAASSIRRRAVGGPMINYAASNSQWLGCFHRFTLRWSTPIICAGLALLAWAIVGVRFLKTSTEFDDMFPAQSRAVQNLNWVEENLGPLNSLEFLVTFTQCPDPQLLDRLSLIERLHEELCSTPGVQSVLAASTFLPDVPKGRGLSGTLERAAFRKTLQSDASLLKLGHVLSKSEEAETWRISARVNDLRSDNYNQTRDKLLASCERVIHTGWNTTQSSPATISVSGLRMVIETAHQTLLSDLASSFATAFALITPMMMFVARGFFSGLVLMIPNVLPVLLVFGSMGWLGIRLDVASILTASVALGIAVDDTLHFVSWYLRNRRMGHTPQVSVGEALQACARPMLHTTIICAAAMLPFLFSDFIPTSKFAILMILILACALVGDLLLLPAMLVSPLGRGMGRMNPTNPSTSQ